MHVSVRIYYYACHMCACTYIRMYVAMYVYMHPCMYVYVCIWHACIATYASDNINNLYERSKWFNPHKCHCWSSAY